MQESDIPKLIEADANMMCILHAAATLSLPDWWIGAGFVRNKIWDVLSDSHTPPGDIDVVYFDPANISKDAEKAYQDHLETTFPTGTWSVTNQARMHIVNGDQPYTSSLDAIAHWPETATAVAITLRNSHVIFEAPCGSQDLFHMIIRPTPCFLQKSEDFQRRLEKKQWNKKWPHVRISFHETE